MQGTDGDTLEITARSRAGPSPRDGERQQECEEQPRVQTEHRDAADENRTAHKYTHPPCVLLPGTGRNDTQIPTASC